MGPRGNPMRLFLVLSLALYGLIQAANFAEYYASPAGNGSLCSQTSPGSIFGVRDKVRSVNSGMTGDIVVRLRGGVYYLDSTFILRSEDRGRNGFNIIYQAYTGETPVLSGGRNLSGGWVLHDAEKGIFKKSGVDWPFRQLFVNGAWAVRARAPNRVSGILGNGYYPLAGSSYPYSVDTATVGAWANSGACEFTWLCHWSQNRARISGYTTNGSLATLRFKAPESTFALDHHRQNPAYGYFENAYALLDAAGEWFLDTAAQTLYYKPRAGEVMASAEVIAPFVDKLIFVQGDSATPVSHVRFQGLAFMHGNWTAPDHFGYVDVQGGHTYQIGGAGRINLSSPAAFAPLPGILTVKYGRNLRVERCVFKNSGAWGIMEHAGSSGNVYIGNRFEKLASGAITLGNALSEAPFGAMPQGSAAFDTVRDNYVEETGYYYNDAVAILALRTRCAAIEHNEIVNVPYTGISLGYSWTDAASADSGNRVRFNRISGPLRLLDDGAGIYSLGRMDDALFQGNYVTAMSRSSYTGGYPMAGIYLDNGSCYKTVTGNVLENLPAAFYASNAPNHDNLFRHNFLNCGLGNIASLNTVDSNTLVSGSAWPPGALTIMAGTGLSPAYADIRPVVAPRPTSLLLRLAFDESAGLTAHDSSGNGFDGVLTAGSWGAGRIGNALRLDGNHAVSLPGPTGPMPRFTVAFWINPKTHSDYNQGLGDGWGQFTFHTTASGAVYCGTHITARFSPSELPAGTLELNTWQHFAFSFDSGHAVFYKNGVKLAQKTQALPQDWTGFGMTSVDGMMDELRIYGNALDSLSVAALAQGQDLSGANLKIGRSLIASKLVSHTPFSVAARISYGVPGGQERVPVRLGIYSVTGQRITWLVNKAMPAGHYSVVWNACHCPGGVYICRLETGKTRLSRMLVLMR